jgi:hypothetical protein
VSVSLTMATNVDDVIDQLLLDLFLESQETAPPQIILDLDGTDIPLYGKQEGASFATCRCISSAAITCCARLRSPRFD